MKPHDNMKFPVLLLSMYFAPTVSHSWSPPPQGTLQYYRYVWPSLLWGPFLSPWVLACSRPCVYLLEVNFLYILVLWNFCSEILMAFKVIFFGTPPSVVRPPGWVIFLLSCMFLLFLLSCINCLYILEIESFSIASFAKMFSLSVGFHFIYLYDVLCYTKFFKFDCIPFVYFLFCIVNCPKKTQVEFISKNALHIVSSRSFMVSYLSFPGDKECTFQCRRKWIYSNFIDLHLVVQLYEYHLLKRQSFLHCIFLPPMLKINCP